MGMNRRRPLTRLGLHLDGVDSQQRGEGTLEEEKVHTLLEEIGLVSGQEHRQL